MSKTRIPRVRAVFCQAQEDPATANALQILRKTLFVDHLGWNLRTDGTREVDEFDRPETSCCALYVDDLLVGGFRAIRTDRNYLAQRVFPQLASVREYPRRRDMWEISRFGILPEHACDHLSKVNYGLMFRFAQTRQAIALVAIADLVYERYLRAIGIRTRRYGPPQVIGTDRAGRELLCVAGEIPLGDQQGPRVATLLELANSVEVHDATLVRRSAAISA
jgi:N-acyl-L-homoserine lactone synthetase